MIISGSLVLFLYFTLTSFIFSSRCSEQYYRYVKALENTRLDSLRNIRRGKHVSSRGIMGAVGDDTIQSSHEALV